MLARLISLGIWCDMSDDVKNAIGELGASYQFLSLAIADVQLGSRFVPEYNGQTDVILSETGDARTDILGLVVILQAL